MVIGQVLSLNWQPDQQYSSQWSTPPLRWTPTNPGRPKTQKPLKSELSKQPAQSSSLVELTAKPAAAALLSPLQWVYTSNSRLPRLNNWIGKLFWPSASDLRGKYFCWLDRFEDRTNHTLSETHIFPCLWLTPVCTKTAAVKLGFPIFPAHFHVLNSSQVRQTTCYKSGSSIQSNLLPAESPD